MTNTHLTFTGLHAGKTLCGAIPVTPSVHAIYAPLESKADHYCQTCVAIYIHEAYDETDSIPDWAVRLRQKLLLTYLESEKTNFQTQYSKEELLSVATRLQSLFTTWLQDEEFQSQLSVYGSSPSRDCAIANTCFNTVKNILRYKFGTAVPNHPAQGTGSHILIAPKEMNSMNSNS